MKRLLIAWAVLGLVASGAWSARADVDIEAPTFSTVAVAPPAEFTLGDTVVATSDAADNVGVVSGDMYLNGPAGHTLKLSWDDSTSTFRGTVTNSEPSGTWTFRSATLTDAAGNSLACFNNGICTSSVTGLHYWTPPATTLSISGTNADVIAPTVSAVAIAPPAEFGLGDTVVVTSDAADNVGIAKGDISFSGPAGHYFKASWDASTSTFRGTITNSEPSGTWTLSYSELYDAAGNWSFCDGSGQYCEHSTGTTDYWATPTTTFTVSGTDADVIAPTLSTVAIAPPAAFSLGDTVVVTSDAADNVGIVTGLIQFKGPAGHYFIAHWDESTSTFRGTVTNSDPPGSWTLSYFHVYDAAGNFYQCFGPDASDSCRNSVTLQEEPNTLPTTSFTILPDNRPTVTFTYAPAWARYSVINFTGSDPDDSASDLTYMCQVDDQDPFQCAGTWGDSGLPDGPHQLKVTATDPEGHVGSTAVAKWTVDTVAPVASLTAPATRFLHTTTVPLGWTADDDSSGVAAIDVRELITSYDGIVGGWSYPFALHKVAPLPATATFAVPGDGGTYCFEVASHDAAGNMSSWSAPKCTGVPLDDHVLSATSGWTRLTDQSALYSGTGTRTSAAGEVLSLPGLQTRHLAITALSCATCGSFDVYLKGVLLKSVNLHASSPSLRTIPIADWSTLQRGTLTIKTTSSGKPVVIDAVNVERY